MKKPDVPTVPIDVRVTVFNVSSVDAPSQQFTCDVYAVCLLHKDHFHTLESIGLMDSFDPKFEWQNAMSLEHPEWTRDIDREGHMRFIFRSKGVFAEEYELQHFPFDTQPLSLDLTCGYYSASIRSEPVYVALQPAGTPGSHFPYGVPLMWMANNFLLATSWLFTSTTVQAWQTDPSISAKGNQYPHLQFSMHFRRRASYYAWNILLPTAILSSLGFCNFSLSPITDGASRLSLSITLLLTSAAYKIVIAQGLPVTNYLTMLDTYVLACFMLLVLLTVQSAVANAFAASDNDNVDVENFDTYSGIGLAAAWAAFNAWFAFRVMRVQSRAPGMCEQRLMREVELKLDHRTLYRSVGAINSGNKVAAAGIPFQLEA